MADDVTWVGLCADRDRWRRAALAARAELSERAAVLDAALVLLGCSSQAFADDDADADEAGGGGA